MSDSIGMLSTIALPARVATATLYFVHRATPRAGVGPPVTVLK
jgi:hypothetical protein